MTVLPPVQSKPAPWQVTVGAEGIAAAQFARCGFDVSVQSGPNKPWYDLVVAKAGNLLKVSVKGSDDGCWPLTETFLKRAADLKGKQANYKGAIGLWLDQCGSRAVCCLVQFQGVSIGELPRIYLASPDEVAQKLQETADRLGSPSLHETYEWTPVADGTQAVEALPSAWCFSEERVQELLALQGAGAHLRPSPQRVIASVPVWPASAILSRGPQTASALGA